MWHSTLNWKQHKSLARKYIACKLQLIVQIKLQKACVNCTPECKLRCELYCIIIVFVVYSYCSCWQILTLVAICSFVCHWWLVVACCYCYYCLPYNPEMALHQDRRSRQLASRPIYWQRWVTTLGIIRTCVFYIWGVNLQFHVWVYLSLCTTTTCEWLNCIIIFHEMYYSKWIDNHVHICVGAN